MTTTGTAPLPLLPELPVLSATVPGMEVTLWNGLLGPANLPRRIVEGMNAAMNGLLEAALEVKEKGTFGYLDRLLSTPNLNDFMQG